MNIRQLTTDDLPKLAACAEHFYASSKFLEEFKLDHFCKFWECLLSNNVGVIFGLLDGERICGVIGGMAFPEPYNGKLVATEMFWWVDQDSRRGTGSMRLYCKFEKWAEDKGCAKVRMIHLSDSMPYVMEGIYKRLGFEELERHYTKDLCPLL